MSPTRIAIDIDEVLCPFLDTMTRWKYPKFRAPKKHPYHYGKLFGISKKESKKMVDHFYFTHDFAQMKPFPESQVHLRHMMGQGYELYAVTGRQRLATEVTEEWLQKYYPNVFRDVILTDSFTDYEIKKSQVCLKLGCSIIVDDSYTTCMDCLENGVHPIHFIGDPLYPWCEWGEWSEKDWLGVYNNVTSTSPPLDQ